MGTNKSFSAQQLQKEKVKINFFMTKIKNILKLFAIGSIFATYMAARKICTTMPEMIAAKLSSGEYR